MVSRGKLKLGKDKDDAKAESLPPAPDPPEVSSRVLPEEEADAEVEAAAESMVALPPDELRAALEAVLDK